MSSQYSMYDVCTIHVYKMCFTFLSSIFDSIPQLKAEAFKNMFNTTDTQSSIQNDIKVYTYVAN